MANLTGFNAQEVEPVGDFEAIPAGKYLAVINGSEMKPTKAGTGQYLELTFQIIDGPYKNRLLWSRLNLVNPNEVAMKIAQGELSAICRAVNVLQPKDSLDLHDLPLTIVVKCKKREDNGEVVNEIRGYSKKETASGAPQQSAGNPPPWPRR